ncbi:MAG TPA: hypothetical protein VGV14_02905 [Rhodanobacter sp.]|nr:hypothetical protein [Rhodanobacter sp.]
MDAHTTALLERIAAALEKIAAQNASSTAPTAREPLTERTREIMLSMFHGVYVSVDEAREALGMTGASSKAVGQVLTAAGFERKRWASGVRFAICEPGGTCVGSPITLPDNLDASVAAAREAFKKTGRKTPIQGLIYGAYMMQGITPKPSQATQAHIDEVSKLYPDFAE